MLKKDDDFFSLCKPIGSNLEKRKSLAKERVHHSEPITPFKPRNKEIARQIEVKSEEEPKSSKTRFKTQVEVQKVHQAQRGPDVILIDDDDDNDVKSVSQESTQEMEKLKQKHTKQKENLAIMHHHLTQPIVSGKRIPVLNLEEDIVFQVDDPRVDKMQKLNNSQSKSITIHKKTEKSVFQSELTPYRPVPGTKLELTPIVAIDCEMVNCEGGIHALARCSIVDYNGHVLFDQIIKPKWRVTNYLTWVSGMTPARMQNAKGYDYYADEILSILKGRRIIGHSIRNDFDALNYYPDKKYVRDLVHYKSLKVHGKVVGLKKMTEHFLGMYIQEGQHNSVEDARATMALYRMVEKQWESDINSGIVKLHSIDNPSKKF